MPGGQTSIHGYMTWLVPSPSSPSYSQFQHLISQLSILSSTSMNVTDPSEEYTGLDEEKEGCPVFEPHVTLLPSLPLIVNGASTNEYSSNSNNNNVGTGIGKNSHTGLEDIREKLQDVLGKSKVGLSGGTLRLGLGKSEVGKKYFQAVIRPVLGSSSLLALRESTLQAFGMSEGTATGTGTGEDEAAGAGGGVTVEKYYPHLSLMYSTKPASELNDFLEVMKAKLGDGEEENDGSWGEDLDSVDVEEVWVVKSDGGVEESWEVVLKMKLDGTLIS